MSLREEIVEVGREIGRQLDGELGNVRPDISGTRARLSQVQADVEELHRRYEAAERRASIRAEPNAKPKTDVRQALLLLADLVTVLGG